MERCGVGRWFVVLGALALVACSGPGEKTSSGAPEASRPKASAAPMPAVPKPAVAPRPEPDPAAGEKQVPQPRQEAADRGLDAVVGGTAQAATEGTAAPAKPGESVVRFDHEKLKEQGPVEFSHPKHKQALGQDPLDCKPCHMQPPPLFLIKKRTPGESRYTMDEMNQGKACGKCHDGKTVFNGKTIFAVSSAENCDKCHQK